MITSGAHGMMAGAYLEVLVPYANRNTNNDTQVPRN